MGYKSLLLISILFPISLNAVEENEPEPAIDLIPPEAKEETLKIWEIKRFPYLSIWSNFGKSEIGKISEVKLDMQPGINSSFNANFFKIEDKNSIGCGIGMRNITPPCHSDPEITSGEESIKSIIEVETEAKRYKIGNTDARIYYLANSSSSFYIRENIFKILNSAYYEADLVWDAAFLLGRNPYENIFVGLGVSIPHIAPVIQLNWMVNDYFSINTSYRNKEVTRTLESIYMNQPYVILNPELKQERWNALGDIKFILGNNITLEITYKEIENGIYWTQGMFGSTESVKPVNGNKQHEWGGGVDLKWQKIKNTAYLTYIPFKKKYVIPFDFVCETFLPTISFINTFEIFFPYNIIIGLESKYTEKRYVILNKVKNLYMDIGPMANYWLFSPCLLKKIKYGEVFVRLNNLTNTKYEIIEGVYGHGRSIQAGFTLQWCRI
ncbi:MAG: hypothetical protein QMD71_04895 [bacterium]|nr:hypothetical protein [bacterium]